MIGNPSLAHDRSELSVTETTTTTAYTAGTDEDSGESYIVCPNGETIDSPATAAELLNALAAERDEAIGRLHELSRRVLWADDDGGRVYANRQFTWARERAASPENAD